jgi:hypothetical protein
MRRRTVEFVQEGKYAAQVPVDRIDDESGWGPYLSFEGAQKFDSVRKALREGDIATASKLARVFELLPVSA